MRTDLLVFLRAPFVGFAMVQIYLEAGSHDDESELCKKIRDEVIQVGEFDKNNF